MKTKENNHFDIVVIGGGPAGVTAALRASELGATVALVERDQLGGTCTNDGCVPTRVLARAARLVRESNQFQAYGLISSPVEVDFKRTLQRAQQVIYQVHEKKQMEYHLENAGVHLLHSADTAYFLNDHEIMAGTGARLSFDKAIICVGGHPRRLAFPGSELAIVHNEVWTLDHLPQSIAIIGASATGCQMASIFSAFGAQVTMLEAAGRILPQEDALTSEVVGDLFSRRNMQLILEIEAVQAIIRKAGGLELKYRKHGVDQALEVEAVLMSTGWVGNIENLGLEAAGVVSEKTYIPVNDFLQTTKPNIFAAGDITGRMMLVQSGSNEGRIAAENAVLGTGQPQKHQIVPHGGFTDPEYAGVGLTEKQARVVESDPVVVVVPYKSLDRAVIDGLTEGFCKLIVSNENHRILGAHIVGEQAVELAQTVAAGMAADMWVEHLADLELAYPTYTSILGLAARRAAAVMGTMPLTPAWRVFENTPVSEWERVQD